MSTDLHYVQACTNGRLHDAREPSIAPLNRGFLYGDAIYEVWRTYDGVIFGWEEHWRRLEQSAAALYLKLPLTVETALTEIRKTVAAYTSVTEAPEEYYIRLQITRGAGAIGLDVALADQTDYVILVQPNRLYSTEKFSAGLVLSVATGLRRNAVDTLNPAWKTGNYLNNILCLREARSRGADEVVILNQAGKVTEAAVSNIAFVRNGEVITPPMSAGIIAGISRHFLLTEISRASRVAVREADVSPSEFQRMDECFILSTTKDITPVYAIDGSRFRVGEGTVTSRLKSAFAEFARDYTSRRPELRLRQ
jgi:branched-subunit amino acid aminotransferase/4-amino-4-deoxychorismate lyase